MGLFDLFRRRRERETAGQTSGMADGDWSADATGVDMSKVDSDLVGSAGISGMPDGLSGMIAKAMLNGQIEIAQQSSTLDLRNTGEIREDILEAMREHGIDAQSGEQIQVTDPELIGKIFGTLSQHGAMPGMTSDQIAALGANAAAIGGADPVDQLERLGRLRDQGVLNEEEFAQQKRRILGD